MVQQRWLGLLAQQEETMDLCPPWVAQAMLDGSSILPSSGHVEEVLYCPQQLPCWTTARSFPRWFARCCIWPGLLSCLALTLVSWAQGLESHVHRNAHLRDHTWRIEAKTEFMKEVYQSWSQHAQKVNLQDKFELWVRTRNLWRVYQSWSQHHPER